MLAILCTFTTDRISAQAADMQDCVALVAFYDSNAEALGGVAAVALKFEGNVLVISKPYNGIEDAAVSILVTGTGNAYGLGGYEEAEVFDNVDCWLWELNTSMDNYKDAFGDSAFLDIDDAHQNEKVTAVYIDRDTTDIKTQSMTLVDFDESGRLTADQYPSSARYPLAMVNGDRKLVGICFGNGIAWGLGDSANFYAGASQASPGEKDPPSGERQPESSGEEKAPPLPEREEKPSESPSEEKPSGSPGEEKASPAPPEREESPSGSAAGNNGSTGSDSSSSMTGVVAAIVLVAVVIALIMIIVIKKKKTASAPTYVPAPEPAPQAAPAPSPIPYPSTLPVVSDKPVSPSKFWLVAKGGCMNGRVYPVEGSGVITIGREVSSVIRYPADTVGVSRVHAKLYWESGRLMLMDCNSTSGTFLQRQGKLTPMNPVAVQSGDIFYVGEKTNSFEIKD